jgi:hypothetical protein
MVISENKGSATAATNGGIPGVSPKKRGRPTGARTLAIRSGVLDLTGAYERMTVRQVFYALIVRGVVAKTEAGYEQVQGQVLRMRRDGALPWAFITDGTRELRYARTWASAEDAVAHPARSYRRDCWQDQGIRIWFWLEKDALAEVIDGVIEEYGAGLVVSRGQASAAILWEAGTEAARAWEEGAYTVLYALYDLDAGGARAAGAVEHELRSHAPGVPIYFERLAVTPEQVREWSLPTRPAKRSDPQAARWTGPAVELDAIPPDRLRGLVEDAILRHIDGSRWDAQRAVQEQERGRLLRLAEGAA